MGRWPLQSNKSTLKLVVMGNGCTFFFFLEVLYRSPVVQAGIPRPTQPDPFAFISKVLKCQPCTPMLTSLMCVCACVWDSTSLWSLGWTSTFNPESPRTPELLLQGCANHPLCESTLNHWIVHIKGCILYNCMQIIWLKFEGKSQSAVFSVYLFCRKQLGN